MVYVGDLSMKPTDGTFKHEVKDIGEGQTPAAKPPGRLLLWLAITKVMRPDGRFRWVGLLMHPGFWFLQMLCKRF